MDAKTGEIVSAEALIRWEKPGFGLISPGFFVPVFEESGDISKLDALMVNNVLRFNLERMEEKRRTVPCAVNLSRVDFYDIGFINSIKAKLKGIRRSGEILKLEVTESAYVALESTAMDFLDEMKRLNIALLLDDFGSGMSSLSTIESYDFDIIKLDMGFVRKIGKSKKSEAIIKSVIVMAHGLGAKTVAEGVETEEQLNFLKEAGCDMIQGYYFYKPMPEEAFNNLLNV